MLRITDKAIRHTPSHENDLAKKFRNMERDSRRAADLERAQGTWLDGEWKDFNPVEAPNLV